MPSLARIRSKEAVCHVAECSARRPSLLPAEPPAPVDLARGAARTRADPPDARLQARLDDPTKHWKFSLGDLQERKRWGEYIQAYEDVLSKTSTHWAPWYIVPANRKWYRNFVIATTIINTLESLELKYPEPEADLSNVVVE